MKVSGKKRIFSLAIFLLLYLCCMVSVDAADPNACFIADISELTVNVNASCSNDTDGTIVSYQWDFNSSDGVNWSNPDATGLNYTYTYPSHGIYTITLRVVDNASDNNTHGETIIVSTNSNQKPNASFSISFIDDLTIQVDASSSSDPDGNISLYLWDWTNDGESDSARQTPIMTHTYTSSDTYTVKLQVIDNGSAVDSTTRSISISSDGSSGFEITNPYNWYYLIIGVVLATFIGSLFYFYPWKKGGK